MNIAVYCVGNRLMLDDGLGPAVYDELAAYAFPDYVKVHDLGCLTLDRIHDVRDCDLIITVDAVDGTGEAAGSVFRFAPEDMAPRRFGAQSLHDLKLADLFSSALLLGYECEGVCFGMQVANAFPSRLAEGLSPEVDEHLPELVDCVLAELVGRGVPILLRATGMPVRPGFHHRRRDTDP